MSGLIRRLDTFFDVPLDAVTARRSTYRARVPLQPREDGGYNADDAIAEPERVVLECVWNGAQSLIGDVLGEGRAKLDAIEDALADMRRVQVSIAVRGHPVRADFLIEDVSLHHVNQDGMTGTITAVGPRFATTLSGSALTSSVAPGVADAAAEASDTGPGGTQSTLAALAGG